KNGGPTNDVVGNTVAISLVDATSCSRIGGTWDGSITLCTLTSSYSNQGILRIPEGSVLSLGSLAVLSNSGYVVPDGILSAVGMLQNITTPTGRGGLVISATGSVDVLNAFSNLGDIWNGGVLTMEYGANAGNYGYVDNTGALINHGTFLGPGAF